MKTERKWRGKTFEEMMMKPTKPAKPSWKLVYDTENNRVYVNDNQYLIMKLENGFYNVIKKTLDEFLFGRTDATEIISTKNKKEAISAINKIIK